MNLALFFILILAGNKHECDWAYGNLCDEKLRRRDDTSPRLDAAEAREETDVEPEEAADNEPSHSHDLTPRQPIPLADDPANTAAVRPALTSIPIVRRSARLKQKARNIPPSIMKGGEGSRPMSKRPRSHSYLEAGESSAPKKKPKQPRDHFLMSFAGSVDGFNVAQEALHVIMAPILSHTEKILKLNLHRRLNQKALTTQEIVLHLKIRLASLREAVGWQVGTLLS